MTDQPDMQDDIPAQPRDRPTVEYAGFWIRFLAVILDTVLMMMIAIPLLLVVYGPGILFTASTESPGLVYDLINIGLPIVAFLVFWQFRSADPGKLMMGVYIVDAKTLGKPSFGQLILRYIGYYISAIPLCLGFIWAAFDKRKQGFHDKIAGTVVIKGVPGKEVPEGPVADEDKAKTENRVPVNRYKSDPWKE